MCTYLPEEPCTVMHPYVFYALQGALSFLPCLHSTARSKIQTDLHCSRCIANSKDLFVYTIFQHIHGWKVSVQEEWNGISELQWLCVVTEPVSHASHVSFHEVFELLYAAMTSAGVREATCLLKPSHERSGTWCCSQRVFLT
jgi:hypothetical protein